MARRALRTRRIGHTGTLDPFASGLLLLCIGRATRIAEYLSGLPKTYVGTLVLGIATDTDDGTGTPIARSDAWRTLDPAAIRAALESQRGVRLQVPPTYSAKKVGGQRLHVLARRDAAPVLDPVEVIIHELEVVRIQPPDVEFRVTCSAGTYVRAIARDAGEVLGSHAHLARLRRTAIGPHRIDSALPVDRLADEAAVAAAWITPRTALAHLPAVELDVEQERAIGHGMAVRAPRGTPAGTVALVSGDRLIAMATHDAGRLRPRKVFADG
jgi:tRNA pseudouridine55 synthase